MWWMRWTSWNSLINTSPSIQINTPTLNGNQAPTRLSYLERNTSIRNDRKILKEFAETFEGSQNDTHILAKQKLWKMRRTTRNSRDWNSAPKCIHSSLLSGQCLFPSPARFAWLAFTTQPLNPGLHSCTKKKEKRKNTTCGEKHQQGWSQSPFSPKTGGQSLYMAGHLETLPQQ